MEVVAVFVSIVMTIVKTICFIGSLAAGIFVIFKAYKLADSYFRYLAGW